MKESALIFFLGYCVVTVNGQIGVTGCTVATQANCPNFLANSYCNLGTLFCECPADYLASDTNIACEYNCGVLTDPDNGAVATNDGTRQGDVAVYTCVTTYKVVGTAERTCVQDTGWDGAQPTCEPAEIGDDCSRNIFQCNNIANGQCQAFSTCQCNMGYQDDGTGLACSDINDCDSEPCQNGATCVDQISAYSCTCVPGYDGDDCENKVHEMVECNCSTQSGVIGAVLGLIILILLVYAGYTTITIRRIRAKDRQEVNTNKKKGHMDHLYINESSSAGVSVNLNQDYLQNSGRRDGCNGHIRQSFVNESFSTGELVVLNKENERNLGTEEGHDHSYVNKSFNAGASTDLNQGDVQNPNRARGCKGDISQLYVNESFSAGVSADLKQGGEQSQGGAEGYTVNEYTTLDDSSKYITIYDALGSDS